VEFRSRLIAGDAEALLFETLLDVLKEEKLVKPRSRQRTDSTHVLAAIQVLNRLELVGETLRHALNTLATVAPEWLRSWVPSAWFDRYTHRFEEYRLPAALAARTALAEQTGADGRRLLTAILETAELAWLLRVQAVRTLWRVWVQQFYAGDPLRWRKAEDLPPAPLLISSPYDPDARYRKKRETIWTGYKVHLTETCDADTPNIVTDVDTTPATSADCVVTAAVQDRLTARDLPPREHLVDTSYVTADHLVTSRTEHACTLLGPVQENSSWQARAGEGFGAAQFVIDWEQQQATCPQGKTSKIWKPTHDPAGHAVVNIRFDFADCHHCPARPQCVSSKRERAFHPTTATVRGAPGGESTPKNR
jgi:transposase